MLINYSRVFTVLTKAFSVCVAFLLTFIVARVLTTEESGVFLYSLTILSVLVTVFRLGTDNVFLRVVASEGITEQSQKIINTGLLWAASTLIMFEVAFFSYVFFIEEINNVEILILIVLSLPCLVFSTMISFAFQGQKRFLLMIAAQNFLVTFVFICLFISVFLIYPGKLDAFYSAWLYFISTLVSLFFSLFFWFSQKEIKFNFESFFNKDLFVCCKHLWIASVMILVVHWSGVILSGFYLSEEEISYFSVSQRTSMIVSFVVMIVNIIVSPDYAKLWHLGKYKDFEKLAKKSTFLLICIGLPCTLSIVLFSESIMGIYGEQYKAASNLLTILTIGQFAIAATGPAGYMLNMTGHENLYKRVTIFSGVLTVLMVFIMINSYGLIGAVIATALGVAIQNLSVMYCAKKCFGFWNFAFFNYKKFNSK